MSEDHWVARSAGTDRNHTSFGFLPNLPVVPISVVVGFPWQAAFAMYPPEPTSAEPLLCPVVAYLSLKHRWEGLILSILLLLFFTPWYWDSTPGAFYTELYPHPFLYFEIGSR